MDKKYVIVIDGPGTEYGELFNSDLDESSGFHRYWPNPVNEEGGCFIVGTIYEVVRTNKDVYRVVSPTAKVPVGFKKNQYAVPLPKNQCKVMTQEEIDMYRLLYVV